jgi:hypothetical protein
MTDKDRLLKIAVENFIHLGENQDYAEVYHDLGFFATMPEYITAIGKYEGWPAPYLLILIDDFHKQLIEAYNMGCNQGCLHKILIF